MKSILLIGLGRFGMHLAVQLAQLGHQVLAVDHDEERINSVISAVTGAQIGDSTDEAFLASLGVRDFDICIVTIANDFQSSLETTSLLKELGAKKVVSRAERDVQEKFLLRNGADEVIYPERDVAKWAAIRYSSDFILDLVQLDDAHSMFELPVPGKWVGRSVGKCDIRKKYHINIMATRQNGQINVSVSPDTILKDGMTILAVGELDAMRKCFHI